jgi:hypothetical protein
MATNGCLFCLSKNSQNALTQLLNDSGNGQAGFGSSVRTQRKTSLICVFKPVHVLASKQYFSSYSLTFACLSVLLRMRLILVLSLESDWGRLRELRPLKFTELTSWKVRAISAGQRSRFQRSHV